MHRTLTVFYLMTVLASSLVEARECYFYVDAHGRRRRRCNGLLPGIIAALVIVILIVLAFVSLAVVLQRRRKRQAAQLPNPSIQPQPANRLIMNQPPAYPPPSYPSSVMVDSSIHPSGGHFSPEKNYPDLGTNHHPIQPPSQVITHSHQV